MSLVGRLHIELTRDGDGAPRAAIRSTRPFGIARAFDGKPAAEVVRMLPLMFSVCGMAQGTAAAEAAEKATGHDTPAETRRSRHLLVLAETAREHLIRATADWPAALGTPKDMAHLTRAMRAWEGLRNAIDPMRTALLLGGIASPDASRVTAAAAELAAVIEELVLGEPIGIFQSRTSAADLTHWHRPAATPAQSLLETVARRGWQDAGQTETHFLPDLSEADLAGRLLGEETARFISAPVWSGKPHETTALGRQHKAPLIAALEQRHGSGLLTRLAARLVEIASLPGYILTAVQGPADCEPATVTVAASSPDDGLGLAHIEAARGRLIHGIEIQQGAVRRYAMLAPTEWNFHPDGVARRGLEKIAAGPDAGEAATLFVGALDPCVGYEVRVH